MVYREITLVRHGETVSNVAGIWQGHGNSGFSARGREQVKRAGARLADERFDIVVSSDLGRAQATAGATGFDFETDRRWREMHLGVWEGLTREEVESRYPDEVAAYRAGDDVAIGGGESLGELRDRAVTAFHDLVDRLPPGGRGLVVAHGGPIMMLISDVLGVARRGALHRVVNTSIARVRVMDDGERQLLVYNDATHLNGEHEGFGPWSQAVLIRHGETIANTEGRWQGRTNGRLTTKGMDQIRRLATWVPRLDALYSSPATRAMSTAAMIADAQGHTIAQDNGIAEIDFGRWEGLNAAEISARFPEQWARFHEEGLDDPRGETGESFASAGKRMRGAIDEISLRHPNETFGLVSHGGVTRAYVAAILGLEFAQRSRLALPANTSMTRVIVTEDGPSLAEYNLIPHLVG